VQHIRASTGMLCEYDIVTDSMPRHDAVTSHAKFIRLIYEIMIVTKFVA
jgi:hypothetical protein